MFPRFVFGICVRNLFSIFVLGSSFRNSFSNFVSEVCFRCLFSEFVSELAFNICFGNFFSKLVSLICFRNLFSKLSSYHLSPRGLSETNRQLHVLWTTLNPSSANHPRSGNTTASQLRGSGCVSHVRGQLAHLKTGFPSFVIRFEIPAETCLSNGSPWDSNLLKQIYQGITRREIAGASCR